MTEEQNLNVPAAQAGMGQSPSLQPATDSQGVAPAHNDGTPFPDRPNSPTGQETSNADVNSGSQTGDISPQLIGEARALGIDVGSFKTEQEINDAILAYDMQLMNMPKQQSPMSTPEKQHQQFQQPEQQSAPEDPFVDLDPDTMDETTYKALSGMQNAMRDMQQQNQYLQQQYEQAMYNEYMTRMMPVVNQVNSQMYNPSTQVGQNLTAMLLETAEGIRQTRASRGRQVSDAEAVNAAHRMLQQQLGLANQTGISDQMIGMPGNTNRNVDMSNDPDARANRVLSQYYPDAEPPQENLQEYFPD